MIPIVIPAYNPDNKLLKLIESLHTLGLKDILIVNDGSNNSSKKIFEKIQQTYKIELLTHAVNLGKGRSLKTALNFCLDRYKGKLVGVVTADADGQHKSEDIKLIIEKLTKNKDSLVLGTRKFEGKVPFKSKAGNLLTVWLFRFLTGIHVSDTQTGLRGIPLSYIPICISMEGERYEYEMNMLINTLTSDINIVEEDIKTVYLNGNKSSHFNPIIDSIKIYKVLFKFFLSSFTTSIIDYIVFYFCISINFPLYLSIVFARLVAGNYNFYINSKIVFTQKGNKGASFFKYWALVFILGTFSYFLIDIINKITGFNVILIKVPIEILLLLISYVVQRNLVFIKQKHE